jgi:hypothetical protein
MLNVVDVTEALVELMDSTVNRHVLAIINEDIGDEQRQQ